MDRTVSTAALAFAVVGTSLTLRAQPAATDPTSSPASTPVRHLPTEAKTWTGDFDVMLERRTIRVRVPYSRSLYFSDGGKERGLSAESVRGFESWLNQRYEKKLRNRPITVLMVPTTRDQLLRDVAGGLGDLAVGNLTVTEQRLQLVDFVTDPYLPAVNEIVVSGPTSPAIATADDLAGKTVHVRRASSYFESLTALNARLAAAGSRLVTIVPVPDPLEDEDMLEMVDVGILEAVVVDDWKAKMWAPILPGLKLNEQAVLRTGGRIGWALRKSSPSLGAEVLAYMKARVTKGVFASRMDWYMRRAKHLRNPTAAAARTRFEKLLALFEKYGQRYREVWSALPLRPPHACRPRLPGVAAEPGCAEPSGCHRHHAGHAGDGQGAQGRGHPHYGAQHPRRREVLGPVDHGLLR